MSKIHCYYHLNAKEICDLLSCDHQLLIDIEQDIMKTVGFRLELVIAIDFIENKTNLHKYIYHIFIHDYNMNCLPSYVFAHYIEYFA